MLRRALLALTFAASLIILPMQSAPADISGNDEHGVWDADNYSPQVDSHAFRLEWDSGHNDPHTFDALIDGYIFADSDMGAGECVQVSLDWQQETGSHSDARVLRNCDPGSSLFINGDGWVDYSTGVDYGRSYVHLRRVSVGIWNGNDGEDVNGRDSHGFIVPTLRCQIAESEDGVFTYQTGAACRFRPEMPHNMANTHWHRERNGDEHRWDGGSVFNPDW